MRLLLWTALLVCCMGWCSGICVIDNKKGWSIDCGIRDSYLFRLKDYGGIRANFDFGLGFGDEKGFPQSISNTAGGYHRKNDDNDELQVADKRADQDPSHALHGRRVRPGPAFKLQPPPLPASRRHSPVGIFGRQSPPQNPPGFRQNGRQKFIGQRFQRVPVQNPLHGNFQPQRQFFVNSQPHFQNQHQHFFPSQHGSHTAFFNDDTPPLPHTPPPTHSPTVGPILGEVLKLDSNTPADTDHVPSFAAKMFIVREAPEEFHPPGYSLGAFHKVNAHVELPRTKFFCEERKYLPGIYADTQLGCKVFHLCLPAAMGNTMTSFLCPNMTLFDQSILQCNWWYYVNCENSPLSYDANLPMALSYRKINAAQLTLSGVNDYNNVALLSQNAEELKKLQADQSDTITNFALKRMGLLEQPENLLHNGGAGQTDGIRRQPRTMAHAENTTLGEEKQNVSKKNMDENNLHKKDEEKVQEKVNCEEDTAQVEDKVKDKIKYDEVIDQQEDKISKTEQNKNSNAHIEDKITKKIQAVENSDQKEGTNKARKNRSLVESSHSRNLGANEGSHISPLLLRVYKRVAYLD
ncbi:uncharacterized protein [Cherax quadricarinatus]